MTSLFPVLNDHSTHFKSLGADSLSYKLCLIFKSSITSPRKRLYANEGSIYTS